MMQDIIFVFSVTVITVTVADDFRYYPVIHVLRYCFIYVVYLYQNYICSEDYVHNVILILLVRDCSRLPLRRLVVGEFPQPCGNYRVMRV
jgi:hypothetical protein